MNGKFEVQSKYKYGSTFSVGFLMSDKIDSNTSTNFDKTEIIDYLGSIAYLDDNKFNLALIEQIMSIYIPTCKYNHEQDSSKWEALIENNKPDIFLLDINMIPVDGLTILSYIKNDPMYNNTKVIMISADTTSDIKIRCSSLGADAYISKPIDIPELLGTIKNIKDDQNIDKQ